MTEARTEFAPGERAAPEELVRLRQRLTSQPHELALIDALPVMTLAVNAQRQTVFASRAMLDFLGNPPIDEVIGKRPGELMQCVHADAGPAGCGTSRFCRYCGATQALLKGIEGESAVEECRLLREVEGVREALDLRIWAVPLAGMDENVTLFTILDVSDEKRRGVLERVFLHDLLNTAGAIRSLATFLADRHLTPKEEQEFKEALSASADRLIAEIRTQRLIAQAESGTLRPEPRSIDVLALLAALVRDQGKEATLSGVSLQVAGESRPYPIETDRVLLGRVLANLLKNAVEGSQPGEVVTAAVQPSDGGVEFRIHNPGAMPPEVSAQVFHRSFSTKGEDRGLGTWSVKLLTETYLGGRVSFSSMEGAGITFRLWLPERLSA